MAYVSLELRRKITQRAAGCCEYCRLSQDDLGFSFHIEHIIAEKHAGATSMENLALSCPACNAFKGSDISSVDWAEGEEIFPLFNPRRQVWDEHFILEGVEILGLTPYGRVTAFLLQFNQPERLIEREILIRAGRYPCGG